MSAIPAPQQPSQSLDYGYPGVAGSMTSLAALQQQVANLQREQIKAQDLLSSLSFSLRSFNNLNQFLALIPLIVSRVTDADAAALVLFRPNGQVSLEQLYCHEGQRCQTLRNSLDNAIGQLKASQKEQTAPLEISHSDRLEQILDQRLGQDYRWFSTSILVRNFEPHERGRLYLFSSHDSYEWTDTRQKLAQLVADQTAVAIENDELTQQVRKQERLARELEIGSEIQARLFPNRCPHIHGVELAANCKTASQVGGDYYDFIPIHTPQADYDGFPKADRWSIVIGDVMGKGVPAGLIMTMTRGILRNNILNQHEPDQILQNLNQVMFTDLENSNRFVTLFYSEFDPETRILRFSNAAHHPPLLWRAATDAIERLDTDGMLIGLDINTDYQVGHTQLCPGDVLIYYTDGFTDAANPSGDRFGEDNLLRTFHEACHMYTSPKAILDYLFTEVETFVSTQSRESDDMTLVVLTVKST
ncbi:MAG: SpoIIE family protein phosphatase [Thermosynechococcaceae cyanobacterium]